MSFHLDVGTAYRVSFLTMALMWKALAIGCDRLAKGVGAVAVSWIAMVALQT